MNTDIRIKTSFPDHPKTRRLVDLMGPLAPWYLIKLWIFAAENKPEGILTNMTRSAICRAMGWEKNPVRMINALTKCGFLDKDENGNFSLHDWSCHNSYCFRSPQRIAVSQKGANARWEKKQKQRLEGCSEHETAMPLAEKGNAPAPVPVPSPLEGAALPSIKGNGSCDAMGRPLKTFR